MKEIVLGILLMVQLYAAPNGENMMHSTVRIIGQNSSGSGLLMIRPKPGDTNGVGYFTLITAGHVLSNIVGDRAVVIQRVKTNGTWLRLESPIPVRRDKTNLWTGHPVGDVAVMHVTLPNRAYYDLLSTELLLTDEQFDKHVQPTDDVVLTGYPLGFEGPYGFPIARSGRIASYPLTPSKELQTFWCDFNGFKGNSGGPVFFRKDNAVIDGSVHLGTSVFGVAGIFVAFRSHTEVSETLTGREARSIPLGLGLIVHSAIIRETVALTPYP